MGYVICALYGQEKRILKLTHRGAAVYREGSVISTFPLFSDKIAVYVAITMGLTVLLNQKLFYRRRTARRDVSVKILSTYCYVL